MDRIEPKLKQFGAIGALVFVLYCFVEDLMPTDVSIGDVVPLVLVLLQLALGFILYALLFTLSGGFVVWGFKAFGAIVMAPVFVAYVLSAPVLRLVAKKPMRRGLPSVKSVRTNLFNFPVPVNFVIAITGLAALIKLYVDAFLENRPDSLVVLIPGLYAGLFGLASGFCYVVATHFFVSYKEWLGLSRSKIIVSPLVSLGWSGYLKDPHRLEKRCVWYCIAIVVLFYPGGYAGLLKAAASASGLRSHDATVVLAKAEVYEFVLAEERQKSCRGYKLETRGAVAQLEGVIVEFHGIGKRTVVTLPNPIRPTRLELRAEDVRVVRTDFARTIQRDLLYFHIYRRLASGALVASYLLPESLVTGLPLVWAEIGLANLLAIYIPTPGQAAETYAVWRHACVNSLFGGTLDDARQDARRKVEPIDWDPAAPPAKIEF